MVRDNLLDEVRHVPLSGLAACPNDARARTLIYWGGPDKVLFVTVKNFNRPQDPFYLFFD